MRFNRGNPTGPVHAQRGIILLEVMLAVTIFCIVGIALAKAVGTGASTLSLGNRETAIRLSLEGEMAEAQAVSVSEGIPNGVQKTHTTDDGVAYEKEWKAVNLTASDKTVLTGLYLLTVRARWTENGEDQVEEASIRVYTPQS